MSFKHIIGNDAIKKLLTNSVISNNVLHSYMFIGEDGIGKFLFASTFAQMILCENNSKLSPPCENCKSCIEFTTNNHPDFFVVNPEDNKIIKIEQVRFLQKKISEKPISSKKKVYIINDSHLMTKEAQNCLLKTLEEPPEYAVLILVLPDESKILNTIKSRCTKINFQKLSNKEIVDYFHFNEQDFQINDNILKACNGSISKALKLQNDAIVYEDLNKIINSFNNKDIIDIWNNSEILYKSKDNINDLLEYINIVFMEKLQETHDIKYGNCIKLVENTKSRLQTNANYDMSIDTLLLDIWREFNEEHYRG